MVGRSGAARLKPRRRGMVIAMATGPDDAHRRPGGVDDRTVEALGKLSEALETVERVRGHLYSLHQLVGKADFSLDEAVALLHDAGHDKIAERVEQELI